MGRFPAVIKASELARTPGASLSGFHFNDVMEEARRMVAEARSQADAMIAEARGQVDRIRALAREEGYAEGMAAGRAEGLRLGRQEAFEAARSEFAERQGRLVEAFTAAVSRIDADRAAWLAQGRHDLIELAVAIAAKVGAHVAARHREVVLANLEEAVRLAGRRTDVTVAVNPADAETARMFIDSLRDLQEHWHNVRVVADPEVSPGGCHVNWGSGAIDATLETQLERIRAELLAADDAAGIREEDSAS